jgi:hypothetical protein
MSRPRPFGEECHIVDQYRSVDIRDTERHLWLVVDKHNSGILRGIEFA